MAETSAPRTQDTAGTLQQVDVFGLPDGKIQEAVVLGDGQNNGRIAGVDPSGALSVMTGMATLFYDTFVGPLDTVDKWTVTGGAPTVASGTMTLPATVSTYNTVRTKDTLRANAGFTYIANGIKIEAAAATGAGRFWGAGTNATTPAAAVLCQDAIGFEINQADGALLAVTYAAGVRTTIATLTRPSDGALHRYAVVFRVTAAYWYIDNLAVAVASASFPNLVVPELPSIMVRQNAASFTGTPVFDNTAHLTAETERRGSVLQDPIIGTRQARVSAAGALNVLASLRDTPVTGQTLNVAAATPITGAGLAVDEAGNATFFVKNTVAGTAYTGTPVVVFEQSDDNVQWGPLPVTRSDTGVTASTHSFTGAANTSLALDVALEGVNWIRSRVTTAPTANGMTIATLAGGMPFSPSVSLGGAIPPGTNTIGATLMNPAMAMTVGTASGNVWRARVVATALTAGAALTGAPTPGAGLSLYITDITVGNSGAALTVVSFLPAAGTSLWDVVAAPSGGGGSDHFVVPIKVTAATALNYAMTVASTSVYISANGYIAA